MESSQEETKTLSISEENKTDAKQLGDGLKIIRCIQTLFNNLPNIKKLLLNLNRLKEIKNLAEIKSIDLIKLLRGTQYSTTIEQFFEFDLAFKKLEEGFGKLKCSHPDCDFQAVMVFEGKDGEPTIQYCEDHFNHSNNSTEFPRNIKDVIKLNKILFDELEIQLIYIQDRIDYIKSDKNQKNLNLYAKIEEEVQRNLDNIRSTLKTTTERIYQIDEAYNMITKNKASMINFDDFLFVKKDLAECRESILLILSLISEPSSKNQAAFLIQVMTDIKKKISLEEERKDVVNTSVPHEIYNSNYKMVNFPSQSLESIKNFEQKIGTISEFIEACQKNASELAKSFSPFKNVLQEQLDQLLQNNYEKCKKRLSLRDEQFYIYNLKLDEDKAKKFKSWFTNTSDVYERLGQFDYGQSNCTTDRIRKCIGKEEFNIWIYIGEMKKGTDDTPHGIGIRVDRWGNMYEGYWEDGRLNGRGRYINYEGDYYIGGWREGKYNYEGIYYWRYGNKYEGRWSDGAYFGRGTFYFMGDKYTGEWYGGYEGKGEINYKDGKKYIGQWNWPYKNGVGTLYSADGQVLNQGKWEKNKYKGKE